MISDEKGKILDAEIEKEENMILGILEIGIILIEKEGETIEDPEDMMIMIPGMLTEEIITMIHTTERKHFLFLHYFESLF